MFVTQKVAMLALIAATAVLGAPVEDKNVAKRQDFGDYGDYGNYGKIAASHEPRPS